MPETFASAVIPADAGTVWRTLRDFGGLAAWQPAVLRGALRREDAPDRVGGVRTLFMAGGGTVVETLVALDDGERSLTYDIVSSPYPVRSYRATMRVLPVTATGEAFVGWSATFDCDPSDADGLIGSFRDTVFAGGLRALAEYCAPGLSGVPRVENTATP
ncbi:SRPBCC family protein [Streptomyces sp. RKCA744]|uniref:SRPBCC family protein n=1 Tax=Streptomyces sp. RKCA744 TaxID=2959340 RepID=UPI00209C8D57|nr:SRPBCC family protein [Streptomyces sp. RKCA744]MCO8302221.1 SRPBCC family protein [Streptomyces sp. RKCA744]